MQQGPPTSPPDTPPSTPSSIIPPPERPRFRLPLRSVILLGLAAGMMLTAVLLVSSSGGGGEEAAQDAQAGAAGSAPSLPQDGGDEGAGGGAFSTTLTSGRLNVELVIVPARASQANQVHVTGLVPDGNLADIQDLVVTLHPPDGSQPSQVEMQRLAGNHLLATEVPMAMPGPWRIELGMRVRETDVDRTRTIEPFRDVTVETEIPVS